MTKFCAFGATVALLACLSGCGGTGDTSKRDQASRAQAAGITDAPTPTETVGAEPSTTIVTCKIDNGLPVAEVKVSNTTDQASAFSVEVQFSNGDTVLGSGMEVTQELQPGQNQTIRMGNMQGDAEAVDTCEVSAAASLTN